MSISVNVTTRRTATRVSAIRVKRLVAFFMGKVASAMPQRQWSSIDVVLSSDAEIARVNERFLGHAGPTDVISFRYAPTIGEVALDAEIIVNVHRALDLGPRFGGVARELALYIAHGCDHLTDENDRTVTQRRRMRRRELRWLREADDKGLLKGLFASRHAATKSGQS